MKKISKFFLLLILLMAGVGQTAKAADVVSDGNAYLYVKLNAVSWWLNGGTDGDHCFVYFYKGSSNQWSAHAIKIDNDHYAFKIPKGTWSTCILTRNNTTSSPTWNNKWNQTGDIALKSDKNYIKSFAESSTSATWDTYQQTSTASSTPSETTIDAGETVTFTSALTSNDTYNVVQSTSYEVSPGTEGTDWTIDGDNNQVTFLTANTYTVTATVTYNAKGFTSITKTETADNQITVNATSTYSLTVEAGEHVTETTGSVDEIEFDTPYAISATVADGYQFAGWSKTKGAGTVTFGDASLASTTASVNGGSATVKASASTITYNITYVLPEGASKGDNPDTYTIETATITLQDASMTGKVFDGWFSEPEFTNQVTEISKGSTGDRTLYAKFHDIQTYRLYYSNPDNWSTVYAFLWKEGGSNNKTWPGEEITANTLVINNRTFYYYEFDETKEWNQIIFNIGSNAKQTGDISFSVPANNNQYNNAKAGKTSEWQNLPEPIDPETPYTTVKVLCDYSSNVKIFFLNKSEDFMVKDAEEDGNTSEYLMNAVGEGKQTIDGSEGYLYEVSFYGTSKMAIFVSNSHIGDKNKLTANDVDLTKAARVTYYYDLTGVTAGNPQSDTFSKIWVPLTQGYGTFCYPQAVQVSQAVPFWMQIQENQDETSGYELMMTAMEDNILPANTGALIYSKQKNAQAILTVVESSTIYEDNDFLGTTERTAMPELATGEKVYVLGNRPSTGLAFYDYQPESGYIPAYKAYFRLSPAAEEPQGAPSRVKMTFRTEPATPTDLKTTKSAINNQQSKILQNGQLIIIRDGQKFNAQGARL